MKVVLTGSSGFLGWHLRTALFERKDEVISLQLGNNYDLEKAAQSLEDADLVIHLAGVNRGTDEEISSTNVLLANQISECVKQCNKPPLKIVYANSIQANNESIYGNAKRLAGKILETTAQSVGAAFLDVKLPNIFGEHGKPFYNSVTSTFCYQIANSLEPTVQEDRALLLVHAQDVADFLIGNIDKENFDKSTKSTTVVELLQDIKNLSDTYMTGEMPDLTESYNRNLFNTFRSYQFFIRPQIELIRNQDERGSFTEIFRTKFSGGQFSFSTTVPGVTRGEHFHRRKIERFTVLSGEATISVRKMFSNEIISFEVSGDVPIAIDMPTLSTHNITNTGKNLLLTSFWINEAFDQNNPDTIFERVGVTQ